ncbi:MAG TPA: hypothetical protein VMS17_22100 [Gemmataceae bacterium]|nr:hypothetical protein [Gemmataceae bacterium]
MAGANSNNRIPPDGPDRVPPVNGLAECENFLLEVARRAIDFREQRGTENGAEPARRHGEGPNRRPIAWPPLSAEDVRLHAWLTERQAVVHYERYGLWPRLRRYLWGNRGCGA